MRYFEMTPPPPLDQSVECLWTLEADAEAADPDRVLPDGTVEIVVHYEQAFEEERDGRWSLQPRALVVGPMSRAMVLRASPGSRALGIRLRAAGGASLLRRPLRELADRVVPLSDLFDRTLERELLGDGWIEPEALAHRTARVLARLFVPAGDSSRLAAAAADRIFASRGAVRVRELAAELGVGERRLQRAFDAAVGLTPKRLARIARLQAVLRRCAFPAPSLADVAADCGYADQAHLTHEFRELVGTSPSAFFAERHPLSDLFVAKERLDRLLDPERR